MLSELCVDTSQEGKDPAGTTSFQGTVHVQVQSCEKCGWKLQATGVQEEVKCKIEKNINSEGERKKKDQASFWQSTLGLRLLIRRMCPGVGFHHEKFALLCCKRSCYMEMLDFLRVLNITGWQPRKSRSCKMDQSQKICRWICMFPLHA